METLPGGKLKISMQARRSEADAAKKELLSVAVHNGLEPVEGDN